MLKLYKTNFTHDELLAMAAHACNFCPFGHYADNPVTVVVIEFAVIFAIWRITVNRKSITGNTAIVKYLT